MYDIKLCHGSRRRINFVAENAERFSTTVDSTSCSSIASRNLATANSIVHRTCIDLKFSLSLSLYMYVT